MILPCTFFIIIIIWDEQLKIEIIGETLEKRKQQAEKAEICPFVTSARVFSESHVTLN